MRLSSCAHFFLHCHLLAWHYLFQVKICHLSGSFLYLDSRFIAAMKLFLTYRTPKKHAFVFKEEHSAVDTKLDNKKKAQNTIHFNFYYYNFYLTSVSHFFICCLFLLQFLMLIYKRGKNSPKYGLV